MDKITINSGYKHSWISLTKINKYNVLILPNRINIEAEGINAISKKTSRVVQYSISNVKNMVLDREFRLSRLKWVWHLDVSYMIDNDRSTNTELKSNNVLISFYKKEDAEKMYNIINSLIK